MAGFVAAFFTRGRMGKGPCCSPPDPASAGCLHAQTCNVHREVVGQVHLHAPPRTLHPAARKQGSTGTRQCETHLPAQGRRGGSRSPGRSEPSSSIPHAGSGSFNASSLASHAPNQHGVEEVDGKVVGQAPAAIRVDAAPGGALQWWGVQPAGGGMGGKQAAQEGSRGERGTRLRAAVAAAGAGAASMLISPATRRSAASRGPPWSARSEVHGSTAWKYVAVQVQYRCSRAATVRRPHH